MADVMYRQFRLERPIPDGVMQTTTWLPEWHKGQKFTRGSEIPLEGEVWVAVVVSKESRTPEEVSKRGRAYTKWRSATDV